MRKIKCFIFKLLLRFYLFSDKDFLLYNLNNDIWDKIRIIKYYRIKLKKRLGLKECKEVLDRWIYKNQSKFTNLDLISFTDSTEVIIETDTNILSVCMDGTSYCFISLRDNTILPEREDYKIDLVRFFLNNHNYDSFKIVAFENSIKYHKYINKNYKKLYKVV